MLDINLKTIHLWSACILVYGAISCGDQYQGSNADQSETASLDQLANGTGNYTCDGSHLGPNSRYGDGKSTGSLSVTYGPGATVDSQKALVTSLGAVPKEIGMAIEALGNSKVLVTSEAAQICQRALGQKAGNLEASGLPASTKTCWIADQKGLTLVFDATPKALSEAVVRTFTYTFTEFLIPLLQKTQGPAGTFARQWSEKQTDLLQAFLNDAKAGDMKNLPATLSGVSLQNAVTAEAFDSYYCSAASQEIMKTQFPQTWRAFVGD